MSPEDLGMETAQAVEQPATSSNAELIHSLAAETLGQPHSDDPETRLLEAISDGA